MKSLASTDYKQGEELATFDAVWRYLLDHSDITPEGTLFVKFHTKSKESFRKSILARMRGLYRHPTWAEDLIKERRGIVLEQSIMKSALAKVKQANEKRLEKPKEEPKRKWWSFLKKKPITLE